ncbi:HSP20-like chaperone [Leucogyrophana mollusca]|uniref:HSP20-like chaperone n=1 Tax=Leucogyrophana mollusca TaxID=85980 RepID=A0ACB8BSZ3_9AGAM|nr:HSP20-like chaperone [Leucogyrophana mollusca]
MSIARQLFHEFRPLFHMLEEPFGRAPAANGFPHRSLLDDPFFHSPSALRPAVDLTEEGDKYILEADLPGVKKENVDIRIGDGGRSVTIEGKAFSRRNEDAVQPERGTSQDAGAQATIQGSDAITEQSSNQLSTERLYTGSSRFTRTVWLPRAVDSAKVSAKLSDGILTLTIPKAEDKGSVKIEVE